MVRDLFFPAPHSPPSTEREQGRLVHWQGVEMPELRSPHFNVVHVKMETTH